eukprot:27387-Chlamydomonas_euryale.AAC.15
MHGSVLLRHSFTIPAPSPACHAFSARSSAVRHTLLYGTPTKMLCVDAGRMRRRRVAAKVAKQVYFNKDMEALKKMQAGADKLATVVGVTIGPKVSLVGVAQAVAYCRYLLLRFCMLLSRMHTQQSTEGKVDNN